ncbi:hypothetical protein MSG28_015105 [Choristoneura fumiferana]|uniref:Uncharacterized protein n=1 Tax=Choristoneura fumiferana TaxID=7141 RepID=A0ACC0KYF0_CHOFU|nr:hypothetical protein MSG28_015105 [Choristoneura fumiferana]
MSSCGLDTSGQRGRQPNASDLCPLRGYDARRIVVTWHHTKSNVLGKIIIPRTEKTIRYILAELEELEREEFFRLKKVQEIKKKRARKPEKKPEKKVTCPVCIAEEKKKNKSNVCVVCSTPLIEKELAAGEKTSDNKPSVIVDLKEQLDLILVLTKEYENIPDDVDPENLCTECKTRFEETKADKVSKKSVTIEEEPDIVPIRSCCQQLLEQLQGTDQENIENICKSQPTCDEYNASDITPDTKESEASTLCEEHSKASSVDAELGVFETDYKTITKIIRRRGVDGNVIEERKVIRIKREVRNPSVAASQAASSQSSKTMYQSSETSNCSDSSHAYCSSKTCGVVTVCIPKRRRFDIIPRSVQSYYTKQPSNMADPKLRNCVSSGSMLNIDINFEEICASLLNVSTSSTDIKNDLKEFITSSIEFKKIMEYFEPVKFDLTVTSRSSSDTSIYQSALTSSNQTLVSKRSIYDRKKRKEKSKSDHNINKCVNNLKTNVSLQSLDNFNVELVQKFLRGLESSRGSNN